VGGSLTKTCGLDARTFNLHKGELRSFLARVKEESVGETVLTYATNEETKEQLARLVLIKDSNSQADITALKKLKKSKETSNLEKSGLRIAQKSTRVAAIVISS
jgi:hypothetical protein